MNYHGVKRILIFVPNPSSVYLLAVVVACGRTVSKASARPDTNAPEVTQEVIVSRPTLISSFVATQAQIDSSAMLNDALSDYQLYLSRAARVLEQHGVQVIAISDSTVRWRDSLGSHSMLAADSGGVLYLFVLPNGRLKSLHAGVELDGPLLAAARDHFGLLNQLP